MSRLEFIGLFQSLFRYTNELAMEDPNTSMLCDSASVVTNDALINGTTAATANLDANNDFSKSISIILIALTCTELLIMGCCKVMAWYAHVAFYSQFAGHSYFDLSDQGSTIGASFLAEAKHEKKHINTCLQTRTYHPSCCCDDCDAASYASECSMTEDEKHQQQGEEGDHTCPICLLDFEDGDTVSTGRKCEHLFHKDCISQWLEKQSSCPCCRSDMLRLPLKKTALDGLGYDNNNTSENGSDNNDNNDDAEHNHTPSQNGREGWWAIIRWLFSGEPLDPEFCLFLF